MEVAKKYVNHKKPIEVTQAHIDNGKPGSYASCPVALAMKEMGCEEVDVDIGEIEYSFKGKKFYIFTPSEVRDFIKTYDNGGVVFPFNFMPSSYYEIENVEV